MSAMHYFDFLCCHPPLKVTEESPANLRYRNLSEGFALKNFLHSALVAVDAGFRGEQVGRVELLALAEEKAWSSGSVHLLQYDDQGFYFCGRFRPIVEYSGYTLFSPTFSRAAQGCSGETGNFSGPHCLFQFCDPALAKVWCKGA